MPFVISRIGSLLAGLGTCLFGSNAFAQTQFTVTVQRTGGSDIVHSFNTTSPVFVPLPTTAYRVQLRGVSGSDSISQVFLSGGPSGNIDVVVGIILPTTDFPPTPAATNLGGIDMSGMTNANVRFGGAISGSLTGPVSGFDYLHRFDVGNILSGSISGGRGAIDGFAVVEAQSISGSIQLLAATSGTLWRVKTNSGDLSGGVYVNSGTIREVWVARDLTGTIRSANGSIGTITVTRDIVLPTTGNPSVAAKTGISSLTARSVTGILSTNYDGSGFSGTGKLGRLGTTNGNFSGALTTYGLDAAANPGGISIAGNLNGGMSFGTVGIVKPITIAGNFTSTASIVSTGALATGVLVSIKGSLSGPVTLPTSGLGGQVIVNSDATGADTWTGSLTVGGATLGDTPYYTATNLGGGAAGLVPFHYHPDESQPQDDSIIDASGALPNISVLWYGPLVAESSTPARVYARSGGAGSWTDFTSVFTFSVDSSNRRRLIVTPTLGTYLTGWEYKVVPKTTESGNRLMCGDLLPGASSPVYDDTADPYSFFIDLSLLKAGSMMGGRSLSGALAAWDAAPSDTDGDGEIDIDDRAFIEFAADWLARR